MDSVEKTRRQPLSGRRGLRKQGSHTEASQEKFRLLVEHCAQAMAVAQDGVIKYANPQVAELTGYSLDELASISPWDIIHPEDREMVKSYFIDRLTGKDVPTSYCFRIIDKQGQVKWLERKVSSITWEGRPAALALDTDITERKQVERSLQGAFTELSAIYAHAPVAMIFVDRDRRVHKANGAAAEFANRPAAEMVGLRSGEALRCLHSLEDPRGCGFSPSCEQCTVRLTVIDTFETGNNHEAVEARLPFKHGDREGENVLLISTSLVKFDTTEHVLVCVQDITERKRAEEALRESEEKYRTLVDNVLVGVFIYQDGKVIFANETFAAMHGYTVDELVGKEYLQLIHPSYRGILEERISERLAGELSEAPFEHLRLRKDGSALWCVGLARRIEYGGKPAALGSVIDITERRQAEQALRESEEKYRQLAENSLTGIFIEQDRKHVYVNARFAQMHGYEPAELEGMEYWRLIHPSEREVAEERRYSLLGGEISLIVPAIKRLKKDGTPFWGEIVITRIEYKGKPAVMGNLIDITERKKLEEESEQIKLKSLLTSRLASVGEMAAGIAHEINNPLTAIIGYAELLASRQNLPDDIKKDLETINSGAKRVADIVRRLLTFARQSKPVRNYVNINELIRNTLELRAYQLRTGNIEVTTELDPNLPVTVADAGQLQQVFLNIITNAETEMKLAHGSGRLCIKTRKMSNVILISFKDNGPGIAEENLEKIFDPFFTTREVGEGTGLGLSICYGIVTEHGGRIWAESKQGEGATFFVELPVVTEPEQLKMMEAKAEEVKETAKARILVVDDEEVIRSFLRRVLTEEGHHVDAVASGEQALEKIKAERYRLIIMDIKMPGMGGMELYRRISEIAESLAERVVFITGDVMGADTKAFLVETGAPYITKPFDAQKLRNELKRLLG